MGKASGTTYTIAFPVSFYDNVNVQISFYGTANVYTNVISITPTFFSYVLRLNSGSSNSLACTWFAIGH